MNPLQCVPFAQKCAPDAGDQIIDEASCLAFYNPLYSLEAEFAQATLNYGTSAEASAGASASFEIGNVYSQDGRYGCYLSYCYGVESDVSIGVSTCFGVTASWDAFLGNSFMTVGSAGKGVEFTTAQVFADFDCFTSDPLSPTCLNGSTNCIGFSVGLAPASFGGYQCSTIVNTVIGNPPDNNPPVARCKNVTVAADASCSADVSIDDGSSDPDGDPITLMQTPFAPYGLGPTSVTLAVGDDNDTADTCEATVTVEDETPPTITGCPGDVTVFTGPGAGACRQNATWTVPTASDNCGIASFISTHAPGDSFPVGETTVTYTATDGAGETAACSFKVTVVDDTPPRFSGCTDVTVHTGPSTGACGAAATWTPPPRGDNCGLASVTSSHAPGDNFPVGETTVTYTAKDTANRTGTCSFKVTVIDDTLPAITGCPADVTATTGPDAATCSQTATWTPPSASDNCGVDGLVGDRTPGQSFPVGETTVTYTAEDEAGGTSECSFKVIVEDDTAPTVTCPASVVTAATSAAGSTVSFSPSAADNCSVDLTADPTSGSVFPIGLTTVTATATDASANQSTCVFTVHVTGADLVVAKSAAPEPAVAGTDLTYTIGLVNEGPDDASKVTVADQTPVGTSFRSLAAPTGWGCSTPPVGASGPIECAKSSVASGESATFALVVRLASSLADGATVSNLVTVGSATQDPVPADNQASAASSVTTEADLALTNGVPRAFAVGVDRTGAAVLNAPVTSDPTEAIVPGALVEVDYLVTNNGPSDARNVVIEGSTPEHTTFVEVREPAGWTCSTPPRGGTGLMSCSTTTLAAGDSAQFTFVFKIDPTVPRGAQISSVMTARAANSDPAQTNNDAGFSVSISGSIPAPALGPFGLSGSLALLLLLGARALRRLRFAHRTARQKTQ